MPTEVYRGAGNVLVRCRMSLKPDRMDDRTA